MSHDMSAFEVDEFPTFEQKTYSTPFRSPDQGLVWIAQLLSKHPDLIIESAGFTRVCTCEDGDEHYPYWGEVVGYVA